MAILPSNSSAINVKPVMASAIDIKPVNAAISGPTQVYTDAYALSAGAPMGLLLALTYSTNFNGTKTRM